MLQAVGVAAGVAAGFLWNSHRATHRPLLRVVRHEVGSGLPSRTLRVLQLSDLHMERLSVGVEQLFELIGDTVPDLVALTGDYLDKWESLNRLRIYLRRVRDLKAPLGQYAVLGNHDHHLGSRVRDLVALLEQEGVVVLGNDSRRIDVFGQRVNVVGVDDYCTHRTDFERAYREVDRAFPTLLLSHDPNAVLAMGAGHRADYVFSGHLHGGQFNVPGAFRLFPMGELPKRKIVKGLHRVNGRWVYISEGLGQSGLNIRFRSRPEVTLHELGGLGRAHSSGRARA